MQLCCVVSTLLKFVISTLNGILGVGFLILALFGILLKTSAPFVRSVLDKAFSLGANINDKEAEEITAFILNNSTGISVILILVGLALAVLCFFGAFASCCGCDVLLKIYAIILLVLLLVQIIAAAVIYSDPSKPSKFIIEAMKELLKYFFKRDKVGEAAKTIWKFAMTVNGTCCGMDGAEDFKTIANSPVAPRACCPGYRYPCSIATAKRLNIPGCRERITNFTYDNLKAFLYVFVAAILIQAALVIVVGLAIFL